ncbi:MAG: type VI secretion system tip protein VgrG [Spongiibacteraceae bacterium]|nr:type VI secretion system tip protein VgrG [Spongiibacteraceae bacterium]
MPLLNQSSRLIRIDTPLGKDAFIATKLNGDESLSDLFNFSVTLLSDKLDITQEDIIGKEVTLSIHNNGDENPRYIHGYVNKFSMYDVNNEGLRNYHAQIVPGFWFTQLASNNRIFHQQDTKTIIETVLKDYAKVVTLKFQLSDQYLEREYCVQFDETDFEFVCRLMAEEGISYFFEHANGKHTLILIDNPQDYKYCIASSGKYDGGANLPTENSIHSWQRQYNYHSGGFEFKDYNEFTTAKDNKQTIKTKNALSDSKSYSHQGYANYQFKVDSDHKHTLLDKHNKLLLKRALEAEESGFDIAIGSSDFCEFTAGGRFDLEHSLKTEEGSYLLVHVSHEASDGNNTESHYNNRFHCVPSSTNVRTKPNTHQRLINYPQVAKIIEVKATGSDNSSDPFTQVKVQFPWNNAHNSCWVRVMQSFAGKNWGANFVPRLDQEVIITYLNGNPDRPIVSGSVYNGTNPGPDYTATQSGFKTQYEASKYNELRFDDKVSSEEVYMEAGKDHNFLIHHDQKGEIENDQSLEVIKNRSIVVTQGNESKTIKTGNQTITIQGTQTTDVQGAITVTSPTSIEFTVGSSSIKMEPSGITIKTVKLTANATASADIKAGAILNLKGGVTNIN